MAAEIDTTAVVAEDIPNPSNEEAHKLLSSYLGLSFAVFLGFLPRSSLSFISTLQTRNRNLSLKLFHTEEQLRQMMSRRREDSKANARVVEIFASHRNGWQQEEKKLLRQIEASAEEIAHLRAKIDEMEKNEVELRMCVEKSQREVEEREEMINFMSRKTDEENFSVGSVDGIESEKGSEFEAYGSQYSGGYGVNVEENGEFGDYSPGFSRFGKMRFSKGLDPISEECFLARNSGGDELGDFYGQQNGFSRDFFPSASKLWGDNGWQDLQYESLDSLYQMKQYVPRRESPWKVDGESTGVSSKLKLLEQELLNLERIGKTELLKVPSLMRKQAKRYQALAGKIDDLCSRMQASDPSEPTLSSEFRTQRQTEFLLEAFRLQQRAIETGQKLTALQTEISKSQFDDELVGQAKLTTRRSLDSIRNNFKEIQRNLEIWLARIMGDLEGLLARDGASRVREYYISRYPFIQ
ncbi:uncharacterized protein LOC122646741 [Telopea speciosissima]|uniref:uncharacterized protein LOC122646741 n=1 Tax=Telopea speciosissima TaxID=54955 RepID=UPI001CC3A355|nr:uncharacterized protein LOC122646741 [Telopea speciosissima]